MMYAIERARAPLPGLSGRVFDPEGEAFCRVHAFAPIDQYPWDPAGYTPEARAWLVREEAGLALLLAAREETVAADVKQWNGEVWKDSCLECFLQPCPGDPRYMNVEVNAAGAGLIGIGEGRDGRKRLAAPPEGLELQVSRHEGGWWAVRYYLSWGFLEAMFGADLRGHGQLRGNFYTCDETLHPHFGCWSCIGTEKPDFHRPEYFGTLRFAEADGKEAGDVHPGR